MKDTIELTLEQKFEAAVEKANKARETKSVVLNKEQLLELYSLFKQATKGDNKTSEPWAFQPVEKAKWTAWKDREGLTPNTAMRMYIKKVEKLIG